MSISCPNDFVSYAQLRNSVHKSDKPCVFENHNSPLQLFFVYILKTCTLLFFTHIAIVVKFLLIFSKSLFPPIFRISRCRMKLLLQKSLRRRFHLRRFGVRMFAFDMSIQCSIRSIRFSTSNGTYKLFLDVCISTSMYFLHQKEKL